MNLVKLQDTKLIYRNLEYLYPNNEISEREIKASIPFTTASERTKYPGVNPPRRHLYFENYDIDERNGNWKNQYCQSDHTTQGNLQIQCNPFQITNGIFH